MSDTDENRARDQAAAQLESICEMVAALDKEAAANWYSRDLPRERCVELLTSIDIECRDDEPLEDLREAVASNILDDTLEPDDFEFDEERAQTDIQEDPLSVEVRSDWHAPGDEEGPTEFNILLCTGGPAVRIIGDLNAHSEPEDPHLEYQDWFTRWERFHIDNDEQQEALLKYCQQFYFGS
jgi:hypothetical protein